ncbi:membrane protein [Mycolicibacterium wolinskyi]|uniref:Membrane protein n=2 Tax=Mycolicibacterium wolinskyi TaxID=59750 RepID=A0A132PS39_9MYCO|nr:membrane protein [Mycolicibacterium wolinskyi]
MVMAAVIAIGGFAVTKIRGIFGTQQLPTYAGSMSDDQKNVSDPKRVVYEIFGPPGAVADVNYIDDDGEPNQVDGVALPWSVEIVTNAPSMTGNVLAQGNSDFIGCRISSDGEVKDERTSHDVNAYIYCFAKSV